MATAQAEKLRRMNARSSATVAENQRRMYEYQQANPGTKETGPKVRKPRYKQAASRQGGPATSQKQRPGTFTKPPDDVATAQARNTKLRDMEHTPREAQGRVRFKQGGYTGTVDPNLSKPYAGPADGKGIEGKGVQKKMLRFKDKYGRTYSAPVDATTEQLKEHRLSSERHHTLRQMNQDRMASAFERENSAKLDNARSFSPAQKNRIGAIEAERAANQVEIDKFNAQKTPLNEAQREAKEALRTKNAGLQRELDRVNANPETPSVAERRAQHVDAGKQSVNRGQVEDAVEGVKGKVSETVEGVKGKVNKAAEDVQAGYKEGTRHSDAGPTQGDETLRDKSKRYTEKTEEFVDKTKNKGKSFVEGIKEKREARKKFKAELKGKDIDGLKGMLKDENLTEAQMKQLNKVIRNKKVIGRGLKSVPYLGGAYAAYDASTTPLHEQVDRFDFSMPDKPPEFNTDTALSALDAASAPFETPFILGKMAYDTKQRNDKREPYLNRVADMEQDMQPVIQKRYASELEGLTGGAYLGKMRELKGRFLNEHPSVNAEWQKRKDAVPPMYTEEEIAAYNSPVSEEPETEALPPPQSRTEAQSQVTALREAGRGEEANAVQATLSEGTPPGWKQAGGAYAGPRGSYLVSEGAPPENQGNGTFNSMRMPTVEQYNSQIDAIRSLREAQNPGILAAQAAATSPGPANSGPSEWEQRINARNQEIAQSNMMDGLRRLSPGRRAAFLSDMMQQQAANARSAQTDATTRRGQDLTAATARRGQDIALAKGANAGQLSMMDKYNISRNERKDAREFDRQSQQDVASMFNTDPEKQSERLAATNAVASRVHTGQATFGDRVAIGRKIDEAFDRNNVLEKFHTWLTGEGYESFNGQPFTAEAMMRQGASWEQFAPLISEYMVTVGGMEAVFGDDPEGSILEGLLMSQSGLR